MAIRGVSGQSDSSSIATSALRKTSLSVYFQNVGGIRSQLAAIRSSVIGCHYDIVVLIETWFDETVDSAELFDSSIWVVYRTDRHDLGDNRNGGGVLIAVRTTYASSPVSMSSVSSVEQSWASVMINNARLFVGAAYIPPAAPPEQYAMIVESTRLIMQSIDDADEVFCLEILIVQFNGFVTTRTHAFFILPLVHLLIMTSLMK